MYSSESDTEADYESGSDTDGSDGSGSETEELLSEDELSDAGELLSRKRQRRRTQRYVDPDAATLLAESDDDGTSA